MRPQMKSNRARAQETSTMRVCDLTCRLCRASGPGAPHAVISAIIASIAQVLSFVCFAEALKPDDEATGSAGGRRVETIVREEVEIADQMSALKSLPPTINSNLSSSSAQKPGMAELNPDASDTVPPYMQHMTAVLVTLHVSVFITGLVGNSLVCLSVYRNKSLQTITNYYIVNLAVADFLVILICLPPTVYWDLTLTWSFGLVLCKLVLYLQSISVSVSVLTLTCISMDRWYAICHPLKFCSTKSRAKITIALIWVASLLIASPDVIFLTTRPLYEEDGYVYMDCTYSWSEQSTKFYQLCIVALLFVLPFVLMTISYAQIVNVLWRNETMAESVQNAMSSEAATAATELAAAGNEEAAAVKLRDKLARHRNNTEQSIQSATIVAHRLASNRRSNGTIAQHKDVDLEVTAGQRPSAAPISHARRHLAECDFDEASELTDESREFRKRSSAALCAGAAASSVSFHERDEHDGANNNKLTRAAAATLTQLATAWLASCRCGSLSSSGSASSRPKCLAAARGQERALEAASNKTSKPLGSIGSTTHVWPRLPAISARYFTTTTGQLLKNEGPKAGGRMKAAHGGVKLEVSNYHEHEERPVGELRAPSKMMPPPTTAEGQPNLTAHSRSRPPASEAIRAKLLATRQVVGQPLTTNDIAAAERERLLREPNLVAGLELATAATAATRNQVVGGDTNVREKQLAARLAAPDHQKHGQRRPLEAAISFIMMNQTRQLSEDSNTRQQEPAADDDGTSASPLLHDKLVDSIGPWTLTETNKTTSCCDAPGSHPTSRSRSIACVELAHEPSQSLSALQSSPETSRRRRPRRQPPGAGCVPAIKRRSLAVGELAALCRPNENDSSESNQRQQQRQHHQHRCRHHHRARHNHHAHHRCHSHQHHAKCLNRANIQASEKPNDEEVGASVASDQLTITDDYHKEAAEGVGVPTTATTTTSPRRQRCCCQRAMDKKASPDVGGAGRIESRGILMVERQKQRINANTDANNTNNNSERIKREPLTSDLGRAQTNGSARAPIKLAVGATGVLGAAGAGGGARDPHAPSDRLIGCEAPVCCSKCCLHNKRQNKKNLDTTRRLSALDPELDRRLSGQSAASIRLAGAGKRANNREIKNKEFQLMNEHSKGANGFAPQANNLVVQPAVRNSPKLVGAIDHCASPLSNKLKPGDLNQTTSSPHGSAHQRFESESAKLRLPNGCVSLANNQTRKEAGGDRQLDWPPSSSSRNSSSSNNSLLIDGDHSSAPGKLSAACKAFGPGMPTQAVEGANQRISLEANGTGRTWRAASSGTGRHTTVGSSLSTGSSHMKTRFCRLVESRKKAAKMLIVIVIMFGLCYLPVHLINTLRVTIGLPQNDITTIASLVSHWLCYFNSAVNPLIYNLMSGKFRHEFANLFFCRWLRRAGNNHTT